MNEFELIQYYFNASNLAFQQDNVTLGIGDDCCVLDIKPDYELVLSIDTLVEDVHFPKHAQPYDIATRALCVSLSDLAAMCVTPIGFTLAITLPKTLATESWMSEFANGLSFIAQKFNCPLIGGDTTKGPALVLSLQVHGQVQKGTSLKRSGAQVGDKVYVSGPLGNGAGALSFVLEQSEIKEKFFHNAFYQPLPKIEFGQKILNTASSGLDVSDGLLQDLGHICKASGVSINIDSKTIPLADQLIDAYGKEKALEFALSGGDDYQLAYTAKHCDQGIEIGEVLSSAEQQEVLLDGNEYEAKGFQHF